ncbi:MAG TPA: hypothetical protein VJH21_01860 [Candidatus Paceibacterota bacterium]
MIVDNTTEAFDEALLDDFLTMDGDEDMGEEETEEDESEGDDDEA